MHHTLSAGHLPRLVLLVMALASMAGCVDPSLVATAAPCHAEGPDAGDLEVHVYPDARHLEVSDWGAATDKKATITPMLDNESNSYVQDKERLPAVSGPLDDGDCILFQGMAAGWWEIRATAGADTTGCTWYGAGGKMVLVDAERAIATGFEPMLSCT